MRFFQAKFAILLTLTAVACDRSAVSSPTTRPSARETAPVTVEVTPVTLADLPITVIVTGSLFGDEQATISAKVGGRVAEILADVGDRVGPGAPLARIDPIDYQIEFNQKDLAVKEALAKLGLSDFPTEEFDVTKIATIERARFQRENAKAKMDRAATLMSNVPPPISAQEFADMQTEYEVARRNFDVAVLEAQSQLAMARAREAEAQAAKARLDDTTIRAPRQPANASADHFAVAARLVSAGEFVNVGIATFRVVADRPIKFRGAVPERFANQVQTGQRATLRVDGVGDVDGTVNRVSPAIDPASRTFEVEILTPNADGRLRAGGFARATIIIGEQQQVSLVPADAIVSFAGVDRVFIVENEKAKGVRITLGEKVNGKVAVAEKLPAQTPIILRGDRGVADGIQVRIGQVTTTTQPSR